jgi:hypothetical protein
MARHRTTVIRRDPSRPIFTLDNKKSREEILSDDDLAVIKNAALAADSFDMQSGYLALGKATTAACVLRRYSSQHIKRSKPLKLATILVTRAMRCNNITAYRTCFSS